MDWKNVGISAGNYGNVPNYTSICSTLGVAGQLPTFAQSTTLAQVTTAITNCGVNQVVFFNPGTYSFAGICVAGKSNYVLRGSGPLQTIIKFTAGNFCTFGGAAVDIGIEGTTLNYGPAPNHLTTWTAGYSVGTTVVTLGSVAGLSVGQLIILDQANDTVDGGAVFVCDTWNSIHAGSPGGANPTGALVGCDNSGNGPTGTGRTVSGVNFSQQQLVKVTGINGNQVTIDRPLYMPNWRIGQTPGAWWSSSNVSNVGIENMTLDHGGSAGSEGIRFFNAYGCWVRNVRDLNSNRAHVQIYLSARVVVRDSYFYGVQNGQGNGSQSYGVETFQGSDNLIINNIFQHVTTPILMNSVVGQVMAYNYNLDNFQVGAIGGFQFAGPYYNHAAGSDMLLEEGDIGIQHLDDAIHGSKQFISMFRSFMRGRDPGFTSETAAVTLMSHVRFGNFVGNVFGEAGFHNTYQANTPTSTNCNNAIYNMGWANTGCAGDGTSPPAVPNDPLVASTVMRWGNYDVVNNTSRFLAAEVPTGLSSFANPLPANNNLPTSFFFVSGGVPYTNPPTWWRTPYDPAGGTPWPAIGPDVTGGTVTSGSGTGSNLGGHVYKIPAMLCQNNLPADTTNYPGSNPAILAYDAGTCYPFESLTTPDSPSSVGSPVVGLSPVSLSFGNQALQITSTAQLVTLTNTGTATLTIASITLTGTNPGDYTISSNTCGASLSVGANCVVGITLKPTVLGSRSANLTFATNASTSPDNVALSGTGAQTGIIFGVGSIGGIGVIKNP